MDVTPSIALGRSIVRRNLRFEIEQVKQFGDHGLGVVEQRVMLRLRLRLFLWRR
jgi:hypothetical protein